MEPVTLVVVATVLGLGAIWSLNQGRNRPFTNAVPVFHASRWTRGNRLWPTQVAVFPNRVVRYTLQPFGQFEEAIGIDQVASVRVHSRLIFSDVIIQTTEGARPIRCDGHRKADAEKIRRTIVEARARQPRSTQSRANRRVSQ